MFYLAISIIILIIILTILYVTNAFRNFSYLKNLKANKKKIYYLVIILFLIFLISLLIIDLINVFVVLFHFMLFSFFINLVSKIIKNNNTDLTTIISLILTIAYMGYGLYSAYNVRKTTYNLKTDKEIENIKIAQISDSHIGTTFDGNKFKDYVLKIASENPDLIVITGDYVDDNTTKKDMIEATASFKNLNIKYGIYYVFGNHDKGLMNIRDFTEEELRDELKNNGVKILEDEIVNIGENTILIGRQDRSVPNRKSSLNLVADLDPNKYIIVLDHQPNDYENLAADRVDLVLSGHTHGGQLIPLGTIGILSGSNDMVYGHEKRNKTDFIVSSGISDWELKFKTGTFSEYVIINVESI